MQSEAIADRVNEPPDDHLGAGVFGADALHDASALFGRARVHRAALPTLTMTT